MLKVGGMLKDLNKALIRAMILTDTHDEIRVIFFIFLFILDK